MTEDVWYRDGLQFECTRCGACCMGGPGYVWVSEDEVAAISDHLGESLEVTSGFYTRLVPRGRTLRDRANGDCIFYDRTAGCTIYPVRPRQCRTWPFWESNVASPESWQSACSICPGAGQGPLISADEILARVKVIRI